MTEWQPLTWQMFHTIALNFNEAYKDEYITFFDTLKTIIPCKMCRNHYIAQTNIENLKIENNINSEKIFNWTIDLHNNVNVMNRKRLWSYDGARSHYTNNNFNNGTLKQFIFEYIKLNFKKNPLKTTQLVRMIKTLPYFHPNGEKRDKLIDFSRKFDLNRGNIKSWLYAFLIILKS
jgi:hypothetical protein